MLKFLYKDIIILYLTIIHKNPILEQFLKISSREKVLFLVFVANQKIDMTYDLPMEKYFSIRVSTDFLRQKYQRMINPQVNYHIVVVHILILK